jgi:hypothetical protein
MKKHLVFVGLLGFLLGLTTPPAITMLSGRSSGPPLSENSQSKELERNPAAAARREQIAGPASDLRNPLPINDTYGRPQDFSKQLRRLSRGTGTTEPLGYAQLLSTRSTIRR